MSALLVKEFPFSDPISIFAYFAKRDGAVLFESAERRLSSGRYSFIAVDPFQILTSKNGVLQMNGETVHADPLQYLAAQLAKYLQTTVPDLPPFQGGVAGYFAYDLFQHLETIPAAHDDVNFPDLAVGFYDVVLAFDHEQNRAWIFSNGYPEIDHVLRKLRALQRLTEFERVICDQKPIPTLLKTGISNAQITANFTPANYQAAVQQVINYILAGDIFEANISQRFSAELPKTLPPFALYQRLRALNPAPFAAYLNFSDTVVASASPERFLQLRGRAVETRPIKGTARRDEDPVIDQALAAELCQSAKNRAENIMIVDLLRNDLSRVCEPHSVNVPQLCGLESYATVHHLVSMVTGKLKPEYQALDLLRVCFPGGSITGAPKIRAMEIISEIEPTARGLYCGSIGYIGFNGDMDTSIAIRTFAIKDQRVTFQAGGAIVLDSDPLQEYEETLTKAHALLRALTHDFAN